MRDETVVVLVDGWIVDKFFDSYQDDWSHGETPDDYARRCNRMYKGSYQVRYAKDPSASDLKGYCKSFGF